MLACVVVCLVSVGCCGPLGCGPGCGVPVGCNDCDGLSTMYSSGYGGVGACGCGVGACGCVGPVCGARGVRRACGGPGIARASADRIQSLKRTLVCGSGCGETYLGEWISTPPDASDPCCGDQFVGGATKCRPFCWQRGTIARNLYGGRYYNSYRAAASCGCGVASCGCGVASCGYEGEIVGESYISDSYIETPSYSHGGASCATCNADNTAGGTRIAKVAKSQSRPKKVTHAKAQQDKRLYR